MGTIFARFKTGRPRTHILVRPLSLEDVVGCSLGEQLPVTRRAECCRGKVQHSQIRVQTHPVKSAPGIANSTILQDLLADTRNGCFNRKVTVGKSRSRDVSMYSSDTLQLLLMSRHT